MAFIQSVYIPNENCVSVLLAWKNSSPPFFCCLDPDRHFHSFKASGSGDRRIQYILETCFGAQNLWKGPSGTGRKKEGKRMGIWESGMWNKKLRDLRLGLLLTIEKKRENFIYYYKKFTFKKAASDIPDRTFHSFKVINNFWELYKDLRDREGISAHRNICGRASPDISAGCNDAFWASWSLSLWSG